MLNSQNDINTQARDITITQGRKNHQISRGKGPEHHICSELLCFKTPSPLKYGFNIWTTGLTFSFPGSSRSLSLFDLEESSRSIPSLSPVPVSTPRSPNALHCPPGRSFKLGARGRCRPRARPPTQGTSQRISRYIQMIASRNMRKAQGPIVMRPRKNCGIRGRSATAS